MRIKEEGEFCYLGKGLKSLYFFNYCICNMFIILFYVIFDLKFV